jgi:hypothetical protein
MENWRRGSAALPQIKYGRADLPVSLDIGETRLAESLAPPNSGNHARKSGLSHPASRFVHGCELLAV